MREGLVAALGPMRLTHILGAGPAKQLCFLGRRFSAQEGLQMGLLAEVCEPELLEQRALAIANELLEIPFTALKHTKRQIDQAFTQDFDTLLNEMVENMEDCLHSPEHKAVMTEYLDQLARRGKSN